MMISKKGYFKILLGMATILLFGTNLVLAQTNHSYGGQGTGINANVSVLGLASVNTRVAQTDSLDSTGGQGGGYTRQVLNGTVSFGALGLNNNLNTGVLNTMTSGGNQAGTPDSSQSSASVATLNALLLSNTITADVVNSNSQCTAANGVANCTGNTTITNLRINGVLIDVTSTASVSLVGGVGTVFINEQVVEGSGQSQNITVNALRISLNAVNLLVTDIVISQSKSGMTSAINPPVTNVCTPFTTVTEGDLFAGGIVSFGVTGGAGTVTVDHVNAGTGMQVLSVLGIPGNALVVVNPFTLGTYNPVQVTFTVIDPNLPVDFTLRSASTYHAANIRVRCVPNPTPTPILEISSRNKK